jgi:alcohol dehydrogenase
VSALPLEFLAPTRIVLDDGGRARIAAHLAGLRPRRVLLVADPGVERAGILGGVRSSLARAGIEVAAWMEFRPNPRVTECEALATAQRGRGTDLVLAVGGGSAIDAAKAVALLLVNEGTALDYAAGRSPATPPLPIACIPTTAGTGSEVTRYAVLTDPASRRKVCLADAGLIPALAVLDAEVLATLPGPLVASTGLDALTHAIEAYTCRRANPFSDALALAAIRTIAAGLEAAAAGNPAARRQMLVASTLAGMAFGNADVAAVHCLSEALGGRYDWPHGVCNARLLPHVFRHNGVADPLRHAEVGYAMGIDSGLAPAAATAAAADALEALVAPLGVPRLGDLPGADPADFAALATAAKANVSDPSNAREMDERSYAALLEAAFRG